jgi:hypothetical protein
VDSRQQEISVRIHGMSNLPANTIRVNNKSMFFHDRPSAKFFAVHNIAHFIQFTPKPIKRILYVNYTPEIPYKRSDFESGT